MKIGRVWKSFSRKFTDLTKPKPVRVIGLLLTLIGILVPIIRNWPKPPELGLYDLSPEVLETQSVRRGSPSFSEELIKVFQFKLVNQGEGVASIQKMSIEVIKFEEPPKVGSLPKLKMRTAEYVHEAFLSPNSPEYILAADGKYRFPATDEALFTVALKAEIPGIYTVRASVAWYDQRQHGKVHTLKSHEHKVFLAGLQSPATRSDTGLARMDIYRRLGYLKDTFQSMFVESKMQTGNLKFYLKNIPRQVQVKFLVPLDMYYSHCKAESSESCSKRIFREDRVQWRPYVPPNNLEILILDDSEVIVSLGEDVSSICRTREEIAQYTNLFLSHWQSEDYRIALSLSPSDLERIIEGDHQIMRSFALERLIELRPDLATEHALNALDDQVFRIRSKAEIFLSKARERRAVPHFIRLLSLDPQSCKLGALFLSNYGPEIGSVATYPLVKAVEEGSKAEESMTPNTFSECKFQAINALEVVGDSRALPILKNVAHNLNYDFREAAARAAVKIAERSHVNLNN